MHMALYHLLLLFGVHPAEARDKEAGSLMSLGCGVLACSRQADQGMVAEALPR